MTMRLLLVHKLFIIKLEICQIINFALDTFLWKEKIYFFSIEHAEA